MTIVTLILVAALTGAPATPIQEQEEPEITFTEVWNETEQDFDCLMNVTSLLYTSVNLIAVWQLPGGPLVTSIKGIGGVYQVFWLIKSVNSCLNIKTVKEELWSGVKVVCNAGKWLKYPGSRQWWCPS